MSFIYDDEKLINELLKSAIDFENRFLKKGQQAAPAQTPAPPTPAAPPDRKIDVSAAIKLLDNIERSASQDPGDPLISSSTGDVNLTGISLEDLGSLVALAADTGLMINYQKFATRDDPKDPNFKFYKLEGNALFEIGNEEEAKARSQITKGFYVNKDLLVQFIQSLQKMAYKTQNRVMQVQLGSLIEQANRQLRTKIGPYKPKETPGEEKPGETKPGGKGNAGETALVLEMVNNLPLQAESLDFARIKYFIANFEKLLGMSTHAEKGAILANIGNLKQSMDNASAMTSSGGDLRISMTGSWQDVKNQLASTVAGAVTRSYRPFLDNLSYIVTTTAGLVDTLYAMYRKQIFDRPEFSAQLDEIKQQSMVGGSYKLQNTRRIESWKDATQQAVNLKT